MRGRGVLVDDHRPSATHHDDSTGAVSPDGFDALHTPSVGFGWVGVWSVGLWVHGLTFGVAAGFAGVRWGVAWWLVAFVGFAGLGWMRFGFGLRLIRWSVIVHDGQRGQRSVLASGLG